MEILYLSCVRVCLGTGVISRFLAGWEQSQSLPCWYYLSSPVSVTMVTTVEPVWNDHSTAHETCEIWGLSRQTDRWSLGAGLIICTNVDSISARKNIMVFQDRWPGLPWHHAIPCRHVYSTPVLAGSLCNSLFDSRIQTSLGTWSWRSPTTWTSCVGMIPMPSQYSLDCLSTEV